MSQVEYEFKKKTVPNINERILESSKILEKYRGKFPVICEKDPRSKELVQIDKTRFLISGDLTSAQFSFLIRKKINLNNSKSLFLLVDGRYSPSGNTSISEIYDKNKDVDGFLYITYAEAETFGSS